jgi:hypothetical protein
MKAHWIPIFFLVSFVLGSCATSQPSEENFVSQDPQVTPTQETLANTQQNPIQINSTPEIIDIPANSPPVNKFVQLAKQDLAARLNIDIDQISLVEVTETTWPNEALGCPGPGKVYTSIQVPGYLVRLEANGVEYDYHMDQTGEYILCPDFNLDDNSINPGTPVVTQVVDPGVPIK